MEERYFINILQRGLTTYTGTLPNVIGMHV